MLPDKPSYDIDQQVNAIQSHWQNLLPYNSDRVRWESENPITYWFGTVFNPANMSSPQLTWARLAFRLWDDVIDRSLVESIGNNDHTSVRDAHINFYYDTLSADSGGITRNVNNGWLINLDVSSVTMNSGSSDRASPNYQNFQTNVAQMNSDNPAHVVGYYGFYSYLHEIGHSLGFSHPGAYNASDDEGRTPISSAEYAQDTTQYTVMSYFTPDLDYVDNDVNWSAPRVRREINGTDITLTEFNGRVSPQTPMVTDIAAAQAYYGIDRTTRVGNTSYGFHTSFDNSNLDSFLYDFSRNTAPVLTIWDAGGTDLLDLSGYSQDQTISLEPGTYSSVGGLQGNIGIAYKTFIEHANGGSGSDTITGNNLDNTLTGNNGNDSILGGEGQDRLYGSDGLDTLLGGSGNDWLDGESGTDRLIGGAGDDTYYVDEASDVVVEDASNGTDTVITTSTFFLPENIELLRASGTGFSVYGNELDNSIEASGLGVTMVGGGGNDTITSLSGSDVLNGGTGADRMVGGTGDDIFYVEDAGDQVIESADRVINGITGPVVFRGGNDTVRSTRSYTLGTYLENLELLGTSDLPGFGNELANRIIGNSGRNTLVGNAGDDSIFGGDGRDSLFGGVGSDRLEGQSGNDYLDGGLDNDMLLGGSGDDGYQLGQPGDIVIEESNAGFDTIYVEFSYKLPENVEVLELWGSADANATGNDRGNILIGNSGRNILAGGGGDDLYGADGNNDIVQEDINGGYDEVYSNESYTMTENTETLFLVANAVNANGNSGNNALIGNHLDNVIDAGAGAFEFINGLGGNDLLIGGAGHDEINGGAGNDTFRFTALQDAGDFFYDFTPGEDKIQLNAAAFGIGTAANPLVNGRTFINGPDVKTAAPTLLYTQANGTLFYDADGTGAQAPVVLAILNGAPALSASDITVY